jgi:hypothetical protein
MYRKRNQAKDVLAARRLVYTVVRPCSIFAMKRACIAIGVDEVLDIGKLAKLRAASGGALQFAEWAKQCDPECETQCITDQGGRSVTLRDVYKAVEQVVKSQSYSQLIVYFAGHGILKSADTEIWLLSEAASNPNEAVNLAGSRNQARNSGIPHVVFISDACRSVTDDERLGQVTGSFIFPIRRAALQSPPEIDTFYASLPGDPAYEIPADEATAKYDGIFTKCLLDGLAGSEESLREIVDENRKSIQVVSSRTLKPWLQTTVQERVSSASLELNQFPELRVESQRPKYLARLPHRPLPGTQTPPPPSNSSAAVLRTLAEDNGLSAFFLRAGEFEARQIAEPRAQTRFNLEVDQLLSAVGGESIGMRTGFTVVGAEVADVYVDGKPDERDVFMKAGSQQIRIYERPRPTQSVLIEFTDGSGTCLAALPGYIGAVAVNKGRVANVSYTPSLNSPHWEEYRSAKEDIDKRRAFTAAAARRGIFTIEKQMAASFAGYIRQLKAIDPTLGIYAAYAYAQSGLIEGVNDVFEWMSRETGIPVPFDVALLANRLGDRGTLPPGYAPKMPMLTQGWALLHEELNIPTWLMNARTHLLPSLWTTFSPEGVQLVKRMLGEGRLDL